MVKGEMPENRLGLLCEFYELLLLAFLETLCRAMVLEVGFPDQPKQCHP